MGIFVEHQALYYGENPYDEFRAEKGVACSNQNFGYILPVRRINIMEK